MGGNPWSRVFRGRRSHSYNLDCEEHAERMEELSVIDRELQWIEERKPILENRRQKIMNHYSGGNDE